MNTGETASVKAFADGLKSISLFTQPKTGYKPALQTVRLEADGSELTLVATDRYRLGTYRLKYAGEPFAVSLDADSVALLLAVLKPQIAARAVDLAVSFEVDGDTLTMVSALARPVTVRTEPAEFPKWRSLFPSSEPALPSGVALFNPGYLATFAKVTGGIRNAPMRMTFHGDGKIVKVEIGEYFTGLIMQIRDSNR